MDAGVTATVSKPFTTSELVHRLAEVLGHPSQRSA
jgi:DNA-binding response OmpR family regulator